MVTAAYAKANRTLLAVFKALVAELPLTIEFTGMKAYLRVATGTTIFG